MERRPGCESEVMDPFKLIGALGIIFISIGILRRKRKYQDEFYILGGICLEIYSIHIGDILFMALQVIFTLAAVDDFAKNRVSRRKA